LTATKQGNRLLVSRAAVTALAGPAESRGHVDRLSLAAWASQVRKGRTGSPGTSAADLVWDDRAGR
jgi:hypothetical protein